MEEQIDKINKVQEELDNFEIKCGLPKLKDGVLSILDNIEKYDRKTIMSLSAQECAAISIDLAKISFNFQRQHNRLNAIKEWALTNLKRSIANEANRYDKYKTYEERKDLVIANNEYYQLLHNVHKEASVKSQMLYNLSNKIEFWSKNFQNMCYIKNREEKNDT